MDGWKKNKITHSNICKKVKKKKDKLAKHDCID